MSELNANPKITFASRPLRPIMPPLEIHNMREDTLLKRIKKGEKYTFDLVYDFNNLYSAYRNAISCCNWKKSVQNVEKHSLLKIFQIHQALENGQYNQKPFYEFCINERGKTRWIKALYIEDRIVQRTLSDYILVPATQNYLIYDNGASVKGKGVTFCRDRLKQHLNRYYRTNKTNEGYILRIDFSKFFDNLIHEYVMKIMSEIITDERIMKLMNNIMESFRIDASYMEDDEYISSMITLFNSLDYQLIPNELKTGERFLEKSVGIGSHISQICGIFYPSEIDNLCKIVEGNKYYARYMDDIYVIHESKEYLQDLLIKINNASKNIGLTINEKKTAITPISKPFKYLQIKYILCDDGKILQIPSRKTFIRERHRLRKFSDLLEARKFTYYELGQCYNSWRGGLKDYDCHRSLLSMDKYFYDLFHMTADEMIKIGRVHFRYDQLEGADLDYRYLFNEKRQFLN